MVDRATLAELLHGLARVAPPNEVLIDHPVNGYWRSVPFAEWLAQVRIAITEHYDGSAHWDGTFMAWLVNDNGTVDLDTQADAGPPGIDGSGDA